MPIYEYECPSCGERFERLVKMSDPIPGCPACSGTEVRKLVSAAAFVLKGGGWYKDHYGLKSSPSEGSKSSGSSSGGKESGSSSGGKESGASAPGSSSGGSSGSSSSSSASSSAGSSGSSSSSGSSGSTTPAAK